MVQRHRPFHCIDQMILLPPDWLPFGPFLGSSSDEAVFPLNLNETWSTICEHLPLGGWHVILDFLNAFNPILKL